MAKLSNGIKIAGGIAALLAGAAAGTFYYLKKNKATVLKDGCFVYKFDDLNELCSDGSSAQVPDDAEAEDGGDLKTEEETKDRAQE